MIKEGILHGADTRHKAVQCKSEVEAIEILKILNFLKQQHCTHKQKDPNTWTDIKKKKPKKTQQDLQKVYQPEEDEYLKNK